MSSLLDHLKELDSRMPEPPRTPTFPKLEEYNTIVMLTTREVITGNLSGEVCLITRRKLREIIAALQVCESLDPDSRR